MEPNGQINQHPGGRGLRTRLEVLLERMYGYHGKGRAIPEVGAEIWAAPATGSRAYFLHYFQSQGLAPTANECVTTCVLMAMNMMEDRILRAGDEAFPFRANRLLEDFIAELERRGIAAWKYRFSTHSLLPGMMPISGARRMLRDHAARLKRQYGRSYRVETRSHLTPDDLIQALEQQKVILLHGAWQKRLSDGKAGHLALLGGMPHSMLLVGYEPDKDFWDLLNPAEPWLKSRESGFEPDLFRMTTQQLMDFWGRRFLFYPPRFSITTLNEEDASAKPRSPTPSGLAP